MQTRIIHDNKYIVRNTFKFEDNEIFKQDIAQFNKKEKAYYYLHLYKKIFYFMYKEVV